jgi:hypothetical protein
MQDVSALQVVSAATGKKRSSARVVQWSSVGNLDQLTADYSNLISGASQG